MYLALVRPHLGYATQIWAPQTKELTRQVERIQRRASKFILGLPFRCGLSYKDRLMKLNLLPLTYWHEYLDLIYFFKIVNGIVDINPSVIPQVRLSRPTRSTTNLGSNQFFTRKCKTTTFQKSFLVRTTRIWNNLVTFIDSSSFSKLSLFRNTLLKYYFTALTLNYDPEVPKTWKSICPDCNGVRSLTTNLTCCF